MLRGVGNASFAGKESSVLDVKSGTALIRGVARIFQRGGHRGYSADHHPGIADYIWFIPLLSLVYQRAQSYYRGMKALIN